VDRGIEWLRDAAAAGTIHTVRVSFADRLGVWRGKRVPADLFLASNGSPLGFCDGMLVVDVHADLVQETPFSNYGTGYPDVYIHPDLSDVRRVGWAPGEALAFGDLFDEHGRPSTVAPRTVLARVAGRAASRDVTTVRLAVSGRLMHDPLHPVALEQALVPSSGDRVLADTARGLEASGIPVDVIGTGVEGSFTVHLAELPLRAAGNAGVLAKSALKELARAAGLEAVFMTRPTVAGPLSAWTVSLHLAGMAATGLTALPDLLEDARGFMAPSVNAFRAGPQPFRVEAAGDGVDVSVASSAEGSPETAVACAVAATLEAAERLEANGGGRGAGPSASLAEVAARLEASTWLADWLDEALPVNTAPLLRAEQALFDAAVTDWELERYWRAS
jgi:glutamine synthetase